MSGTENVPLSVGRGPTTHREGTVMYMLEQELSRSRMGEMQAEAAAASRARRLYLARRTARRAERAVRRAARASAAVY
ncbi:hypothetical protein [Blastococcus tunisiensis]|uniref:Uncharacterized protein n=1 Tax=Blastococcus tunisiensis TaxID=1798228 RepID=A0A1I2CBE5_9ACTN|nr:hypothetical protein [Blastococcus sp. DSM 46838]SFE65677.1 hypothetical protein SAMN05216574_10518 [Blastococcus sp. DSM 46838]